MGEPARELFYVRELTRSDSRARRREIALVAVRMRETLIEVLGDEVGKAMYSLEWLRARVRQHLDPARLSANVFLAETADGHVVGHTIVRLDHDSDAGGGPIGLFSTTYVEPAARRHGVARALVAQGEAWLRARGMTTIVTDTSDENEKLIALFEARGYAIVFRDKEKRMVRLAKTFRAARHTLAKSASEAPASAKAPAASSPRLRSSRARASGPARSRARRRRQAP